MLSPQIVEIIDNFWPGPLTIVVKKRPEVPDRTTGGLDTVAVRLPDSEVARELISAACCPIAAPSANLSGGPSPTRAKDVIADMMGRVLGLFLVSQGAGDMTRATHPRAKNLGVLTLIAGIVLVILPRALTDTLLGLVGLVLIIVGIINLVGKSGRSLPKGDPNIVDADE